MISSRQAYYELMLLDPDIASQRYHNRIMDEAYEREMRPKGDGPLTDEQMTAMTIRNDREAREKELHDQEKDKRGEL